MPIPLTGRQRILLTASRELFHGRTAGQVAATLQKTYTHLTQEQAELAVGAAQQERSAVGDFGRAPGDANIFDVIGGGESFGGRRVADVDIEWTDPTGAQQHRTLRVEYGPDDTVDTFRARVKQAGDALISGVDAQGSDTIGTAPPDGEYHTTIAVFL